MDATLEGLLEALLMKSSHRSRPKDKANHPDASETVYISPIALMSMMQHARAGVPMEVMGLVCGRVVDQYTIIVTDVFALPQRGSTASVESLDEQFQLQMMTLREVQGRDEAVVGWYHSHPCYTPFLSSTDIGTQRILQASEPRAIAIVVDPIQSVRGRAMIDCFRLVGKNYPARVLAPTAEPRQLTSNIQVAIGQQSAIAKFHEYLQRYYSLRIEYKLQPSHEEMLNAIRAHVTSSKSEVTFKALEERNEQNVDEMVRILRLFNKDLEEELIVKNVPAQSIEKHVDAGNAEDEGEASNKKDKLASRPKETPKKDEKEKSEKKSRKSKKSSKNEKASKKPNQAAASFGRINARQRLEQITDEVVRNNTEQLMRIANYFGAHSH